MSSLLAILLVVNSARGHHFVFSYPSNPKRREVSSSADEIDYSVANSSTKASMRAGDSQTHFLTHASPDLDKDEAMGKDAIFNLDVSFLADALAPKLPLCNRKFQLAIDDLVFVGHPVSLTEQGLESMVPDFSVDTHDTPSHPSPASPAPAAPPIYASPSTPSTPHTSKRRTSFKEDEDGPSRDGSPHITLFHVAFVLSPPDVELNTQVNDMYRHIILRYMAALRYEQVRCGYVQDEIERILALREEAINKGIPREVVMQDMLRASSLARDIKQLYRAISTNTTAHIIVNDFLDLSLQIPLLGDNVQERSRDASLGSLIDLYSMNSYAYEGYPVLCPYHTLLLLDDPEEILKNMPLDASPTLAQLIQILTPKQNFQELHLLLDCPLSQLYRLAAHLIYWRKAKLIHTIDLRNIFVVSPQATLHDLSSIEAEFRLHFPALDLSLLLSQLSTGKPVSSIAPDEDLRDDYLAAITYLARKDLVIQLHMYLVLILPSPTSATSAVESDTQSAVSSPSSEHPPILGGSPSTTSTAPGHSQGDAAWQRLHKLAHDKAPKEIAELFERLTPYMNGQYPVEEILYREGVTRRQLGFVMKYYRDHIVTVYRPS